MALSQFSSQFVDHMLSQRDEQKIKYYAKILSLLSEPEKKELALLWQGIDFEYFLRDANAQLFTRLAQAAQQNNLAQTLDEKIKENKNLAVLKFLLSIFQTEAQYQIIEILSKVSVGGFLATLDKAALMQLRSMRKVSLDS